MSSLSEDVEDAYRRFRRLSLIIDAEIERSSGATNFDRYVKLELAELGDKPATAKKKILNRLEALNELIEHVAIADMTAAFELGFRKKLSNIHGEAKKCLQAHERKNNYNLLSATIVKNTKDAEGIKAIADLLTDALSHETKGRLEAIRESRNKFSHGTDLQIPPAVNAQDTLDCFITLSSILK